MSWTSVYRVALHLLPAGLRRKHGIAMEDLFAREIARARARGRLHVTLAGAAGIWDVIRRGAYEQVRPKHVSAGDTAGEHHDHAVQEGWSMDAHVPQPTTRQLLRRHAT